MGGKNTKNANRDVVRYVRLPLDLVQVETVVFDEMLEAVATTTLPMVDPHELLDYAWRTGRLSVTKEAILILGLLYLALFIILFSELSILLFDLRKYWEHMAQYTSWAAEHTGRASCAFPVSFYGDEASFGGTHQQHKFTVLALQSPLLVKQKCFLLAGLQTFIWHCCWFHLSQFHAILHCTCRV